jgi:hypothetical protein
VLSERKGRRKRGSRHKEDDGQRYTPAATDQTWSPSSGDHFLYHLFLYYQPLLSDWMYCFSLAIHGGYCVPVESADWTSMSRT